MLARLLRLGCLVLGLVAVFPEPTFAAEPRVALVIGNSNYGPEIGKLLNPANDAKLMADTLKGLGFSVDLVLDADQKAMKRAIKAFGAKLEESGEDTTGLFYYAGHGVQVEGTNFLLPVGAEIEREADVEIESISADDVMTQMQFAGNAVNLVFLDACRNNPLAKANRSGTRGLARLDAPRGSFVGYSTAPGDVAADGDGANSPYALALAEELKKPGISIEEAHRNVRARVLAETGEKQTPWDSSSLTGAVVLVEKPIEAAPQPVAQPAPAPEPQVQQQASVDKEAMFWDSVKDSNDPAEYEAYLQQYPTGSFAPLAKAKIAKLTAPPAPSQEQGKQATSLPSAQSAAVQLAVSPAVQEDIETYLGNTERSSHFWALAISNDGTRVESVSCVKMAGSTVFGCADNYLSSQELTNRRALKICGTDCVLLYAGKSKIANIEIVAQSAALQPAAVTRPIASPADVGEASSQLLVSASVMGEIDDYLRNATSGDRFWALAITKDGKHLERSGCAKVGYSGKAAGCFRGGNVVTQENTDRIAIDRCGGLSSCLLLYQGDRKVANVELITQ